MLKARKLSFAILSSFLKSAAQRRNLFSAVFASIVALTPAVAQNHDFDLPKDPVAPLEEWSPSHTKKKERTGREQIPRVSKGKRSEKRLSARKKPSEKRNARLAKKSRKAI